MATENKVFVPMYGDSFFTTYDNVTNGLDTHVFSSPCMGILFSLGTLWLLLMKNPDCFRPHVWGFFFHVLPLSV